MNDLVHDQTRDPTRELAGFLAELSYAQIPQHVVERCQAYYLDWLGSALAGRNHAPIPLFEQYSKLMGPSDGGCQQLTDRRMTSPHFAALVNAAASHVVEQDDLHNSSVLHPATVVFPAALATAQDLGSSGEEMITAAVAGYEAGIRIGEFLGRSHYRIFHTTGTAGTLAAAVAAGKLMGLDTDGFVNLLGNAGTQAAGLWEFLRDAADSKQLHTAKAASDGLLAAYMTQSGLTGARHILDGPQGMAAGMSTDADPSRLTDRLGERWALVETSFKYHASCRHTHPAADALLALMQRESLTHGDIEAVTARVHQAAIDVLGPVVDPRTIHQAKFSMGSVLGLIAVHGDASLASFRDHALQDAAVASFRQRVSMVLDPEVDEAYPRRWLGRIEVTTRDGRRLSAAIDEPKGDPGNTLSREELEAKFRRLVSFSGAADDDEVARLIAHAWSLPLVARLEPLL
ncbi:MAG: MmgE/PrpD family protein [Salinicola sp.]|uniref:MmgE/PrpD family protein n=1 Tax=Salinicola sp. TaxID=1978524 RepID=UPI001D6D37EC|nr:MmgE/PrpD family protein [Salinicola sp.]NRB55964.1 MmgE/PrpD family protein [Salinicola sp.]